MTPNLYNKQLETRKRWIHWAGPPWLSWWVWSFRNIKPKQEFWSKLQNAVLYHQYECLHCIFPEYLMFLHVYGQCSKYSFKKKKKELKKFESQRCYSQEYKIRHLDFLGGRGRMLSLSLVNHSDTNLLWASVSSCMLKRSDRVFLQVCYTAMWCNRSSSFKICSWMASPVSEEVSVSFCSSWLVAVTWQGRELSTSKLGTGKKKKKCINKVGKF